MAERLRARRRGARAAFPATLAPGDGRGAAAPQLRADHRAVADVGARSGAVRRVAGGDQPRRRCPVRLSGTNSTARSLALWRARSAAAAAPAMGTSHEPRDRSSRARRGARRSRWRARRGCAKQRPPRRDRAAGAARRSVAQAARVDTAVFAGEVKPRHESDLGVPHRRQARRAPRRRRRARAQGPGARAARPGRRRRCRPRRRRRRSRRRRPSTSSRKAEFERYQNLHRAEVHQRERARREAQRDERQPREARAGAGATSRSRRTRRAMRRWSPTEDGVDHGGRRRAGQVVAAGQPVVRLAREDEREVAIACPRTGSASSGARAARRRAVGEPGQGLSGEGARDRAGRRSGDAHVRRARVDRSTPMPARAVGHDRQRRRCRRQAASRRALLPLTSIYHRRTASRRCGSTIRRRAQVSAAPGGDRRSTARTASLVDVGRRDGEWIVAAGAQQAAAGPGRAAVRRRPRPRRRRPRAGARRRRRLTRRAGPASA